MLFSSRALPGVKLRLAPNTTAAPSASLFGHASRLPPSSLMTWMSSGLKLPGWPSGIYRRVRSLHGTMRR